MKPIVDQILEYYHGTEYGTDPILKKAADTIDNLDDLFHQMSCLADSWDGSEPEEDDEEVLDMSESDQVYAECATNLRVLLNKAKATIGEYGKEDG